MNETIELPAENQSAARIGRPLGPDLTGGRFGRLIVLKNGSPRVVCLCNCGKALRLNRWKVISGHTSSCGCLRREQIIKRNFRHGLIRKTGRPSVYLRWCNMMSRCFNPGNKNYHHYGGRGIIVCERWRTAKNFVDD